MKASRRLASLPDATAASALRAWRSSRALVTFSPAGAEGPSGSGVDGFFRDVAVPVVAGEAPPQPSTPDDPEEFGRKAALYGIEILSPPPTLD